ncbi:MAG TPA: zf-TFIIB domain-containing protein [Ignavibacteriales bacterium]|nr:zf-TFIIB domain-containing protein [Ignavibacteriales bacterium]
MQCPICNVDLLISDKQGIEIDYCPKCRGIWLDRGELDKIIERSAAAQEGYGGRENESRPDFQRHDEDYKYEREKGYKNKKKSFLDDLFDF